MRKQKGYPNLIVQPDKFTHERARHAADVLNATHSITEAASVVGVCRKTLDTWRRKSSEFDHAWCIWRKWLLGRRIQELVDAKHEYTEVCRRMVQKGWAEPDTEEEPVHQEPPVAEAQPGQIIGRRITAEEERQLWADWERQQQAKEEAELEAEMEERRGMWTGG